ncbi:MAG: hypothetical protein LW625_08515, partial [Planctomycetaceae bacterium]|nr:hypothetical protein [Planctomycetaceae bacterium]
MVAGAVGGCVFGSAGGAPEPNDGASLVPPLNASPADCAGGALGMAGAGAGVADVCGVGCVLTAPLAFDGCCGTAGAGVGAGALGVAEDAPVRC